MGKKLSRREVLTAGLTGGTIMAADELMEASGFDTGVNVPPFELEEATIASLQDGLKSGRWTSKRLVELYLERIEAVDRNGPRLRHVLETNPEVSELAEKLDEERKGGKLRGPLHGIPILVKDNIATADRMTTTAGSLALEGCIPAIDAFLVTRLRAAGSILLGKTNMSEWANFRSTHSSSGWSGRGGQCRNPYATDRSPSGSSSGSGGAIAANIAAAAVGTETDGSITSPSAANSLVGIKPTLGLISRSGIVPIAHSQDTAGPMARTVRDAAILLGAMSGVDSRDSATKGQRTHHDYTQFLIPHGLKGARIGVCRTKFFGYHPATDKAANVALAVLKSHGAILIDPADLPNATKYDESELEVLLYEFKADLNKYLAGLGARSPIKSLKDAIAFNEKHRTREMPYFQQELMHRAQKKGPLTDEAYRKALANNHLMSRSKGIDRVMDKHKLDALVAPTQGPPWLIDLVNGDSAGGSVTSPAAVAGYPHITVPMGYVFGLPVGLSFFGRAWSEPVLLKLAYGFEQATHARKPPTFAASADIFGLPG